MELEDGINKLHDDILIFILSHLTIKESAKDGDICGHISLDLWTWMMWST